MENREKLEKLGKDILNITRNELYLSMRFLDVSLSALGCKMNMQTRTFGTDGADIQYNTTGLFEVYEDSSIKMNRAYMHMLLHCIYFHPFKEHRGRIWDLACDITVESVIDSLPAGSVNMGVTDTRQKLYEDIRRKKGVLTAETVTSYITDGHFSEDRLLSMEYEFKRDDHRFWNEKRNGQDSGGRQQEDKEQKHEKWKKISEKLENGMEAYMAACGKNVGNMLEVLKIETEKRQDYRDFLRKFSSVREEIRTDDTEFDLNFYTYGMKLYGNIPLIEALESRESEKISDFAIVIDSSGSCAGSTIKDFVRTICDIMQSSNAFFDNYNVHIIESDVRVVSDTVVKNNEELIRLMEHFEVRGFGGTDFRPAFEYVKELQERGELKSLKGMLYLTDGIGIFPKSRPPFETAFVFLRKMGDVSTVDVPPWAMKLVVKEEG